MSIGLALLVYKSYFHDKIIIKKVTDMMLRHFDDVQPNNRTSFIMAYFAINRALSRLEYRLHKSYKGHIPYFVLKELLKIRQKSNQMAAAWKNKH